MLRLIFHNLICEKKLIVNYMFKIMDHRNYNPCYNSATIKKSNIRTFITIDGPETPFFISLTGDYLVETSSEIRVNTSENVQLEVKRLNDTQIVSSFGHNDHSEISLKLPENTNKSNENTVVVLKSYENLGCIINGQKSCDVPIQKKAKQVGMHQLSDLMLKLKIGLFQCTFNDIFCIITKRSTPV